mmetsp:Transcript_111449/g.347390  ORF Transcript_111449/g.347390 Transcript_111449/m.347390 type:complete len:227 (-) Transcript_111449:721-1401(-)
MRGPGERLLSLFLPSSLFRPGEYSGLDKPLCRADDMPTTGSGVTVRALRGVPQGDVSDKPWPWTRGEWVPRRDDRPGCGSSRRMTLGRHFPSGGSLPPFGAPRRPAAFRVAGFTATRGGGGISKELASPSSRSGSPCNPPALPGSPAEMMSEHMAASWLSFSTSCNMRGACCCISCSSTRKRSSTNEISAWVSESRSSSTASAFCSMSRSTFRMRSSNTLKSALTS